MEDEAKVYEFFALKGDKELHIMSVRMNADGTKELILPQLSEDAPILENLDFDED